MPYQFAIHDQDYSDFASGRVIYNLLGLPAFPVRLASEIFQRARALLPLVPRLSLYDPTCGGAYHLTALGLLHGAQIAAICASDIDPTAVDLARRNLSLLTPAGLDRREAELRAMAEQFGKDSHRDALRSLDVLRGHLLAAPPIQTHVFQANVLDPGEIRPGLGDQPVHLVIADIPYGQLSAWQLPAGEQDPSSPSPLWRMLDALRSILPEEAVVAIAADKAQKIRHEGYRRVDHFKVGKRQIVLLQPLR